MATSPHFNAELSCHCGCGLNNVRPELLDKLEQLRALVGLPIVINSASRCPTYNTIVGGAHRSEHLSGEAVDIACFDDDKRFHLLRTIFELGFSRVGIARTFIHVGISEDPYHAQGVVWTYS